ncbi:hypothetical protein KIPB_015342, partial [Kipferlia bialata]|eukprot:g15342.t1
MSEARETAQVQSRSLQEALKVMESRCEVLQQRTIKMEADKTYLGNLLTDAQTQLE